MRNAQQNHSPAGHLADPDAPACSLMMEVQACRKRWREAVSSENMHHFLESRLRGVAAAEPAFPASPEEQREPVRHATAEAVERVPA